jgi:hypothetical protein
MRMVNGGVAPSSSTMCDIEVDCPVSSGCRGFEGNLFTAKVVKAGEDQQLDLNLLNL